MSQYEQQTAFFSGVPEKNAFFTATNHLLFCISVISSGPNDTGCGIYRTSIGIGSVKTNRNKGPLRVDAPLLITAYFLLKIIFNS